MRVGALELIGVAGIVSRKQAGPGVVEGGMCPWYCGDDCHGVRCSLASAPISP